MFETGKYRVNAPVFVPAVLIIVVFAVATLANLDRANQVFQTLQTAIASSFGWFYVFTANALLVFALAAAFGRGGSVRLGGADARPEFSRWEWFAMLFSAGMGIGLLFYAVAEPLLHFQTPPGGATADAATAARDAMGFTFLHWGLHAWAIYGVIGLGLALVAFNRGLPLTVGAVLAPILPKRSHALRHAIDVLAIVATVFGIATSLGLGATQVNAGLARLFGLDNSLGVQLVLVAVITAIALVSVALGLSAGIKRLSELNMSLAGLLGLFVLFGGPTLFILNGLVENIGHYLQHLPRLATWNETWTGGEWQNDWTVFYYAWWISWAPFVGMFIARISRGRTVREFVLGVLLAPTLLTFLWLTIFGNTALHFEMFGNAGLAAAASESVPEATFFLLELLPLATITCLAAVFIVVTFFVTSADSGALVLDFVASGGREGTPAAQRILWAITLGIIAAVLLAGGGLTALQTASLASGLPFAVVLLAICVAVWRVLGDESRKMRRSGSGKSPGS